MQLGTLNSMLRGLPMQQASTQMYQAAPSAVSQMAGLGTAALGASSLLGKADGGLLSVKKMSNGGSAIPMSMMSPQQLQQMQRSPAVSGIGKVVAQGQMGLNNYITQNPQSAKIMAQPLQQPQGLPPQQPMQADPTRVGLNSIATGDMTKLAGGGILAFADGDQVPGPDGTPAIAPDFTAPPIPGGYVPESAPIGIHTIYGDMHFKDSPFSGIDLTKGTSAEAIKPLLDQMQKEIEDRKGHTNAEALTRLGLGLMAAPNRTGHNWADALSNLGTAGTGALNYMGTEGAANASDLNKMANLTAEASKSDEARQLQFLGLAGQSEMTAANKALAMKTLSGQQELLNQARLDKIRESANASFIAAVSNEEKNLQKQTQFATWPTDKIHAQARNNVISNLSPYMAALVGDPAVSTIPKAVEAKDPPGIGEIISNWFHSDPTTAVPTTAAPAGNVVQLTPVELQAKQFAKDNANSKNPTIQAQVDGINNYFNKKG